MTATIVEEKKDDIAALCRTYHVRALCVFGSATTDTWRSETSDVDFLVDLSDYSSDYASRFFSLRRELADLIGRDADLVSARGLGKSNDWFRAEVDATKVLIYDAGSDQLVA